MQHTARVPGVTHKMPRAVVRGVLRGCVLAAEFVKGVSAPRGVKTTSARLYYKKQGGSHPESCGSLQ